MFTIHSDVYGTVIYTLLCAILNGMIKSDVFATFKDVVAKSEAHFNSKVLLTFIAIMAKNDLSNDMKDYCVQKGISYPFDSFANPSMK